MASNANSTLNKYLLLVDVRSGADLPKGSYVKVIVENQEQKTAINTDSENPLWNEKMLFRFDHIPQQIEFRAKHDRTLLPNTRIGEYIIDIHASSNHDLDKPIKLMDGVIVLDNAKQGKLDVKITLHNIDELNVEQYEFKNKKTIDDLQQAPINTLAETRSISSSNSNQKQEVQEVVNNVLPPHSMMEETTPAREKVMTGNDMANNMGNNNNDNIVNNNNNNNADIDNDILQSQPQQQSQLQGQQQQQQQQQRQQSNIIEQPVEVYRRIIHVEKPRIVEVPIYKEIHEYIREEPQYITQDANVIEQDFGSKDVSQLSLEDKNRLQQYDNNQEADIIFEKEQITLATEIRELPPQVHEKQIIYEQPIEIERRHIETIKPTVHEQVKVINEHVTMKDEPETKVADTVVINQGHQYFTKDTTKNLDVDADSMSTTSTNVTNTNNDANLKHNTPRNSNLDAPIMQQ